MRPPSGCSLLALAVLFSPYLLTAESKSLRDALQSFVHEKELPRDVTDSAAASAEPASAELSHLESELKRVKILEVRFAYCRLCSVE